MSDHDGYNDLAARRAQIITEIASYRASMRRLASAGAGPSSAAVVETDSESEDDVVHAAADYLADADEESDGEDLDFESDDDDSSDDDEYDGSVVSESDLSGSDSERED